MSAVRRLHAALPALGVSSALYVLDPAEECVDPTVRVFSPATDVLSRLRRRVRALPIARDRSRYLENRPAGSDFFTDDRTRFGAEIVSQLPPADIIHIHTMFGFVDYRAALPALARRAPIVRTVHDTAFFTGGCHVNRGCGRFAGECGQCPQLGSTDPQDFSHRVWMRKQSVFAAIPANRLWIVSPSEWMAADVKRSGLTGKFPVVVIPNGVDPAIFKPRDRAAARDVLAIPAAANVLLFVAEPMDRPVKGFAVLARALQGLQQRQGLILVTVGRGRPPIDVPVPHIKLEALRSEALLSLVYSAADLLVMPSLQENLPLVPLEAMACGVPVVGSDVPGIREVVGQGAAGFLAPPNDPAALREAIDRLLGDPRRRRQMGEEGRRLVLDHFTLADHARGYLRLYQRVLSERALPGRPENERGHGRVETPARVAVGAPPNG